LANLGKVETHLHPKPEIGGAAKRLFQPDGHLRRNAVLPLDDAVKLLSGDAKPSGRLRHGQAERVNIPRINPPGWGGFFMCAVIAFIPQ
jgi:hypothetical protein